jgi:hypothetical protein
VRKPPSHAQERIAQARFGDYARRYVVDRMSMREKHGMEDNGFSDCYTAFCCSYCELIQEDKEMVVRHPGDVWPSCPVATGNERTTRGDGRP